MLSFCRHLHSKRKGSSLPTDTRANSCPGYVSFKFVERAGVLYGVVSELCQHKGHNPKNPEENRVASVDVQLRIYIETLAEQVSATLFIQFIHLNIKICALLLFINTFGDLSLTQELQQVINV